MITDILKNIGKDILKIIIDSSLKKINPDSLKIKKDEFEKIKQNFPDLYEIHFTEICKWAYSIPFIGLSKPKETKGSTVELLIASDILKLESSSKSKKVSENEILNSEENILLVGAPGAGKTTTLKRLILKYITEISKYDKYGFPILVRLRDIHPDKSLPKYILDIFSIGYEERVIETIRIIKTKGKDGKENKKSEIIQKKVTLVGDLPINQFLIKFLNYTQAFLMLDGLDEIEKTIQDQTFREIETIGLRLTKAKILLTVRKSELHKLIENFTSYEIAPLSSTQISEVAKKWLTSNSKNFISELNKKPYKDLANRPIFLTLLMVLYDKYTFLPTQPSEVYEDATYLIIKEWDEHRDIIRTSKYADFNTRKKIKFLSEISYFLTYKIKQKIFSAKDLESIYLQIYEKYGLPKNEIRIVISEIESHTGIIVESKYKHFEFSHLSIQEFLCAKHLVNLPYSQETISYFLEYPEPLAIAVSISGEPSLWLSNLLLNSSLNINNFKKQEDKYYNSIYTLLSRLLVENPSFKSMQELGFTFFYLVTNLYRKDNFKQILDELFEYPGIKESLSLALKGAACKNTFNDFCLISKSIASRTEYFIQIPYSGEIPAKYIQKLLKSNLISITKNIVQ